MSLSFWWENRAFSYVNLILSECWFVFSFIQFNFFTSASLHTPATLLLSLQTSSESGSFEILTPVGGLHNLFCWAKQKLNETQVSKQDVIENKDFKFPSTYSSIADSLTHTLKLKGPQI